MHRIAVQSKPRRRILFEQLERRELLAATPFGTNPLQPFDVTRDGIVSAGDALRVINALASRVDRSKPANPADHVGIFIDVSGNGEGTALDALRVINVLGREQPIIAATLPVDSGTAEESHFDLLTNHFAIDLSLSVRGLDDEIVGIRINGSADEGFSDITSRFIDNKASLSPADFDAIVGQPLSDGDHRVEVRVGETGSRIDFTLTIDRTPPTLQVVGQANDNVQIPIVYIPYQIIDTNVVDSAGEEVISLDAGENIFTIQATDLAGNTTSQTITRTYDPFYSLPPELEQFRSDLVQETIGLFTIGAGIDPATGTPIDAVDRDGNVVFRDPGRTDPHDVSQPASIGFTLVNQASIITGLSPATDAEKIAAAEGSMRLLSTIESLLDGEHGAGVVGLVKWLDLRQGGFATSEFAFVDNGALVLSLAATIGLYDSSGFSDTVTGQELRQKAESLRQRLTGGLLELYDSNSGLFKQVVGETTLVDRLGSEWRSIVAFLIGTETEANRTAWDQLELKTSTYVTQEQRVIEAMTAFDGGLFQITWPTLFLPEQEYALRDLQLNHLVGQLDHADQNDHLGPLSAAGVAVQPYGYEGASGILQLAENALLNNTTIASLYALLSGTPLAPELVLGYTQQLVTANPSLRGPHGLFDSASRTSDGIDVREMYLAIDSGSSVIGLTGAGQIGMMEYLTSAQDAAIRGLYADKENGAGIVPAPPVWPQPPFAAMETVIDLSSFDAGSQGNANVSVTFETDRLVYRNTTGQFGYAIGGLASVDANDFPTLLLRIRNASGLDTPQVNVELRNSLPVAQDFSFVLDGRRDELLIGIPITLDEVVAFGLEGIEPDRTFELLEARFVNSLLREKIA